MSVTPEQIERIRFLRATGRSTYSISVEVGCTLNAVYRNSKAPRRPPDAPERTCSAGGCIALTSDDAPICPDCLPRFDARPVRRAGAELDHMAIGRAEA